MELFLKGCQKASASCSKTQELPNTYLLVLTNIDIIILVL